MRTSDGDSCKMAAVRRNNDERGSRAAVKCHSVEHGADISTDL